MTSHSMFDALADWLQARSLWVQPLLCVTATNTLMLGLLYGFTIGADWFLLLIGTAASAWLLWVKDHGFSRHLDRKYPTVATLACTHDDPAVVAARAAEAEFWRGLQL